MYRRKHKHKLRIVRITLVLVALAGSFWVWQKNQAQNGVFGFAIEPAKISRSIGAVLGSQISRLSDLAVQSLKEPGERGVGRGQRTKSKSPVSKQKEGILFKFAVVADTHEDTRFFPKILNEAKAAGVDFVVHLGDLSNAGNLQKLQEAKDILAGSGLAYIALPGDHDYNLKNFVGVFQEGEGWRAEDGFEKVGGGKWNAKEGFYFVLKYKGVTLIFLDSSDNQNGVPKTQLEWLNRVLQDPDRLQSSMPTFLLTQAPPFSPYFAEKQIPNGADLLKLLSGYKIDEIFAGNTHTFARYPDKNLGLEITTCGAVGTYKNFLPMWTEVAVFEDGRFEVEPRPLLEMIKK